MQGINHPFYFPNKFIHYGGGERIQVSIYSVLVNPDTLEQVKRPVTRCVVYIESFVKCGRVQRKNPDRIRVHVGYQPEPAQVLFFCYSRIARKSAWFGHSHVDAFYQKILPNAVTLNLEPVSTCSELGEVISIKRAGRGTERTKNHKHWHYYEYKNTQQFAPVVSHDFIKQHVCRAAQATS